MSIRWRLTVFNALAIGAILMLLGIGLFLILRESLLSNAESTVQSRAKFASSSLELDGNSTGGTPNVELEDEATEQLSLDGVFVVVRNRDGRVLYESVNLPPGVLKRDTVWREVARTGEPASGTADLSREAPDYIYAMRVGHGGGPPLILRPAAPTATSRRLWTP